MNLDIVKTAVTSTIGRQLLQVKGASPTIMFGAGVVGVVTTTVLACKATLKLEDILDHTKDQRESAEDLITQNHPEYTKEDFKRDNTIITVRSAVSVLKLYAPAIGVGIVSIAALTGSHVVLSKRNAGLMAAYSALDKGFNEYRARVRDEYGEEKDIQFRHGHEVKDTVVQNEDGTEQPVKFMSSEPGGSIYARMFDSTSPSWSAVSEYNILFLNCQQNYANDLLHARGHVFLNEVYDRLGLPRTKAGAVVGWVKGNGDNFVDFNMFHVQPNKADEYHMETKGAILLDFNVDGVIYDLLKD